MVQVRQVASGNARQNVRHDAGHKPAVISQASALAVINGKIRALGKALEKVTKTDVQEIIVLTLEHGNKFGDVSALGRLCSTLDGNKLFRVSVVAKYITENTIVNVSKTGGSWNANLKKEESDKYISFDDSIKHVSEPENAFWLNDDTNRGDPGLFTLTAADDSLVGLIGRIKRNITPNKAGEVKAEPNDIPKLRGLLSQLEAIDKMVKDKKLPEIKDDNTIVRQAA